MTKPLANKAKRQPNAGSFPKSTTPAGGKGWGGQAKGTHEAAPPAAPFEVGNQAARGYHDMSRRERLDALAERKWMIAMGLIPDVQPVEIAAANSYENRDLGLPVARNINTDDVTVRAVISDRPLTVDEWSAEYGAGLGAAAGSAEGPG